MKKIDLIYLCHCEINLLTIYKDDKIKTAMCVARYKAYSALLYVYFGLDIEQHNNYREIIQGAEKFIYEE